MIDWLEMLSMKKKFHFPFSLIGLICLQLFLTGCKHDPSEEVINEIVTTEEIEPVGHMAVDPTSHSFIFRTNGGGTIYVRLNEVPEIKITHDDYEGFQLDFWGSTPDDSSFYGMHESLNWKHLKDRLMNTRTIIFPDGAKLTMIADGVDGPLISVSIYDMNESHRIDIQRKELIHSSENLTVAEELESQEADGEAGGFEFTETGLIYFNSFIETTPGILEYDYYLLGELLFDSPNAVLDHYDDPRFDHT